MDKQFDLKIITPVGKAFDGPVRSVSCPGTVGRFQVLFNHAPLLSSLEIGPLDIETSGANETYAISGGFAQVFHNSVLVLAETAEKQSEIDVDRAKEAKDRAEDRLANHRKEIDVTRAELSLHRAVNRLKVAGSL